MIKYFLFSLPSSIIFIVKEKEKAKKTFIEINNIANKSIPYQLNFISYFNTYSLYENTYFFAVPVNEEGMFYIRFINKEIDRT